MDERPNQASQAENLMVLGESMTPMIEWAEGQKTMMVGRGWSAGSAEAYALELLLGLARTTFAGAAAQQSR